MVIGVQFISNIWLVGGCIGGQGGAWKHIGAPRAFRGLFVGIKDVL